MFNKKAFIISCTEYEYKKSSKSLKIIVRAIDSEQAIAKLLKVRKVNIHSCREIEILN